MHTFQKVTRGVRRHVPEIVQGLDALANQDPWSGMSVADRINALPELVHYTCALAFSRPRDPVLCRKVLEIAAHHGAVRRRQGIPDTALFNEFAIIRNGVWQFLQERYRRHSDAAMEAILELDTVLGLASQASLRGYFRPEFEAAGGWDSTLHELEWEWLNDIGAMSGRPEVDPAPTG